MSVFHLSDLLNETIFDRRGRLREQFVDQKPFSFIQIDDFLKPQVAAALADEYPPMRGKNLSRTLGVQSATKRHRATASNCQHVSI
jgi:hypothetical protein